MATRGACHAPLLNKRLSKPGDSNVIDRYTRPEMKAIWTDEAKFQTFLDVEIAVCEAQCQLGRIPREAVDDIKQKAGFDIRESTKSNLKLSTMSLPS